jgi:beclin 1
MRPGTATCDRCRNPLVAAVAAASSGRLGADGSLLADSYVVLPQHEKRRSSQPLDLTPLRPTSPSHSSVHQATSMHEHLRTVERLLELSDKLREQAPATTAGVPLCEECAPSVLAGLQRKLEDAHHTREMMQRAFAELEAGEEQSAEDMLSDAEHERERVAQQQEEETLRAAIASAQEERAALRDELERLREQRKELKVAEDAKYDALNDAELQRRFDADQALRASQLADHCERQLERLQAVDVLSDVFAIDEGAGTINGLRLGRSAAVEWSEANAALGQVVLLLVSLGRLHALPFRAHVLAPAGSFSRVYKLDGTSYELYGTGAPSLGRLFGASRFERGLGMLLTCVGDLCDHAAKAPRQGVPGAPPHAVREIGAGFISSPPEGKRLLGVLRWLLQWHAAKAA